MSENSAKKKEPKPRKPRAKKQPPTKEQVLKQLDDTIAAIHTVIDDLKQDQQKIPQNLFKNIPTLVEETLKNLNEDIEEIKEERENVANDDVEQAV